MKPLAEILTMVADEVMKGMRARRAEMFEALRELERKNPEETFILWIEGKDVGLQFAAQGADIGATPAPIEKASFLPRAMAEELCADLREHAQKEFADLPEELRPSPKAVPVCVALRKMIELADDHMVKTTAANNKVKDFYALRPQPARPEAGS